MFSGSGALAGLPWDPGTADRARQVRSTATDAMPDQFPWVDDLFDFLPFLDAQRSLTAAGPARAASHAQLAADQVAIFLALGGGWEP
jgi:hypothetical protein